MSLALPVSSSTTVNNLGSDQLAWLKVTESPHALPDLSLSPLRYPGSKRKLFPALHTLLRANRLRPTLFVEPFCGGASLTLGLLHFNLVDRAVIGDADPLVASFWIEAANNPEDLIQEMEKLEVTVQEWERWNKTEPRSSMGKALKCLFLNRTTFSGIMGRGSGPIGGRSQNSSYKIDCRFNKKGLARRIRNIGRLHSEGRLRAVEADWGDLVNEVLVKTNEPATTLFYFDPPYVEKAHRLYRWSFKERDHRRLLNFVSREADSWWILSYDEEVRSLCSESTSLRGYRVDHSYTTAGRKRAGKVAGREVLFTNLVNVPTDPESEEGK